MPDRIMAGDNQVTGILNVAGAQTSAELKDAIQSKRITVFGVVNASGKLKNSVRYDIKDAVMRVYSLDYIYYLEKGRKPGKRPPRSAIRQWIDDKGITPDGISKDSLAFLIQRKIGEEGNTVYQQGGSTLIADILPPAVNQVKNDLILTFKNKTIAGYRSAITGQNGN